MNTSFQGNVGSQIHGQRQPRIARCPIGLIANSPGKVAGGKTENTGKLGKETCSATVRKTKA